MNIIVYGDYNESNNNILQKLYQDLLEQQYTVEFISYQLRNLDF